MRFRLTFRVPTANTRIPLAYNCLLSGTLCEWFGIPSVDHHNPAAYFNHQTPPDPFVFSRLLIKSKLVDLKNSTIKILSPSVVLYLGLAEGLWDADAVVSRLAGHECPLGKGGEPLIVDKIEPVPPPNWSRRMTFRMLSPAAVAGPEKSWLVADNPLVGDGIRKLLVDRYRSLFNTGPLDDDELTAVPDPSYLGLRGGGAGVVKRVRLVGADPAASPLEVQGFICPITLQGNPRLISLAYDSGLGMMNMFGFGMIG